MHIYPDRLEMEFLLVLAQNAILQKQGTAFQDFFASLGSYRWGADFEARRPQGKLGDKKCDGYRVSDQTVFQCYAPRQMDAKKLMKKIAEDFDGAIKHQVTTPLKKWVLVHNDFDGLPTEAHELIISLRNKHKGSVVIEIMGPEQLLVAVNETSLSKLRLLFPNGLSGSDIRTINFKDIDELIGSMGSIDDEVGESDIDIPSSKKIEHNKFSDAVAAMLKAGLISQKKFEDYFSQTSRAETGNRLARKFKKVYLSNKDAGADADEIFHDIASAAGGLNCHKRQRATIVGLISYLFHSCEIFENVPHGAQS